MKLVFFIEETLFKFKHIHTSLPCLIPLNKFSWLIYSDSQSKHEARLLGKLWKEVGGVGGECLQISWVRIYLAQNTVSCDVNEPFHSWLRSTSFIHATPLQLCIKL